MEFLSTKEQSLVKENVINVDASTYLEENVFPVLLKGLEHYLETCKKSDGTFDRSIRDENDSNDSNLPTVPSNDSYQDHKNE